MPLDGAETQDPSFIGGGSLAPAPTTVATCPPGTHMGFRTCPPGVACTLGSTCVPDDGGGGGAPAPTTPGDGGDIWSRFGDIFAGLGGGGGVIAPPAGQEQSVSLVPTEGGKVNVLGLVLLLGGLAGGGYYFYKKSKAA